MTLRRLLPALAALACAAPARAQTAGGEPHPAVRALRADLREALSGPGRRAALVVSLDRGDTLHAVRAGGSLAPASTLKLFSTAAALWHLGPDFRFSTYLLADGETRGETLEGDLILHGTGDPTLSGRMTAGAEAVFAALADSLRARGVRVVAGDLVADASYFDARFRGEGWTASDLRASYGAPVAALLVSEGVSGGRPVADPVRTAADLFRAVLARRGIAVRGRTRTVVERAESRVAFHGGGRTEGAPPRLVAIHLSPTVAEIARVTNHLSHNLFADALAKAAGRAATGEGSFAGGERATFAMLRTLTGEMPAGLRMEDGSGLSRLNRATAGLTVGLLEGVDRSPISAAFRASLPAAGDPRGLRRMRGTPAAWNLRAKTGTIRGVSALAGYVAAADGERLAFSFIGNEVGATTAPTKRGEDAAGVVLSRFRRP